MRKYNKPSALLSKFDVEDVMTLSGDGIANAAPTNIDLVDNAVYKEYLGANTDKAATGGYVEFQW